MNQRTRGRRWQAICSEILRRDPVCRMCGIMPSTEVDHVKRLTDGGTDHHANLQGLCHDCHAAKTAREAGKRPATRYTAEGRPIW